ncbi:MAG: gentisate 1,2-dioxygenase [Alphaproteobacteria bacterium]|jgi:gentisate 1,2-dioxygenase|nr:gentisate 1,2-dioxygenase [Alphaproteobacteria bacterium]
MAEPAIAEHRQADGFVSELEARNLHPLWDRYQRITPIKPQAQDAPFLWRWREVEPFLHRSVAEVSINDIERRALILAHPAFATDTTTTSTLLAAFTVLDPGDRARPHRHTGAAIRFATRAEGAVTIVNGRRCKMQEGDLILTPPMVWHGHINESDHRIIWFDAANMPLIRAVDAHFFEPGDPRNNQFWQVDEGEEALWTEAGLVAEGAAASPVNSPKYHYPGEATRRLLAAAPAGSDGARTIRYVNPSTGGAVMPTLDCYAARLTRGTATRLKRATYNVVCLIVRGEGRSHIGDQTFEWSQHDVFTIPHWTWARHEPQNGDADLFMVTDKSAFERLDLVREELQ